MGLLQFFTASLVRKKVLKNLQANCPADLQGAMQSLMADKAAAGIVGQFLMDAMKNGGKVRAEAVTALPFSASVQELLAATPKLATYIALAARMAGKR